MVAEYCELGMSRYWATISVEGSQANWTWPIQGKSNLNLHGPSCKCRVVDEQRVLHGPQR